LNTLISTYYHLILETIIDFNKRVIRFISIILAYHNYQELFVLERQLLAHIVKLASSLMLCIPHLPSNVIDV